MNKFLSKLPTMYKAAAAFISLLIPFLTAVAAATSDGMVTGSEWTTIGVAATALVSGTAAVYKTRNKPAA